MKYPELAKARLREAISQSPLSENAEPRAKSCNRCDPAKSVEHGRTALAGPTQCLGQTLWREPPGLVISGETPRRCVKWPGPAPTDPECAYNDALRRDSALGTFCGDHRAIRGFKMTEGGRSFEEMLAYRIALLKIDSAFEACRQFGKANKKSFFEEIRNRLSQQNADGHAEALVAADRAPSLFSDRCFELADMAPTDEIRRFLLSVVEFCDANPHIENTGAGLHKCLA